MMSDNKKYYYLKLKDSFFDSEEMKIIESQKNGIEYQNLYLKLCLLSLKYGGKLCFRDIIPYDCNMLSTILRVNIDTIKTGIELFAKLKLIEIFDNGTMYLVDIQTLIGESSTEADRVRAYREKIKQDKKCTNVITNDISNVPRDRYRDRYRDKISTEVITKIYISYPSKDKINKNRSTGKCSKNKDKIKALLKQGYTETQLIRLIKLYVSDCEKTKTYMKNFGTFLNNLPDEKEYQEEEESLLNKKSDKQRFKEWVDKESGKMGVGFC